MAVFISREDAGEVCIIFKSCYLKTEDLAEVSGVSHGWRIHLRPRISLSSTLERLVTYCATCSLERHGCFSIFKFRALCHSFKRREGFIVKGRRFLTQPERRLPFGYVLSKRFALPREFLANSKLLTKTPYLTSWNDSIVALSLNSTSS